VGEEEGTRRWLELTEQGFRPVPDRAETVREIFGLSAEGLGVNRILQHLVANPKKYPPFGDSGRWGDNWTWAGVQFVLRTGKVLAAARNEIVVRFRPVPHLPFGKWIVGGGWF